MTAISIDVPAPNSRPKTRSDPYQPSPLNGCRLDRRKNSRRPPRSSDRGCRRHHGRSAGGEGEAKGVGWRLCTAICKRAGSALPMARRRDAPMHNWKRSSRKCGRAGSSISVCPGQHDDLGISCAMLNWAAHHPHLEAWMGRMVAARRPRRQRQTYGWGCVYVTRVRRLSSAAQH